MSIKNRTITKAMLLMVVIVFAFTAVIPVGAAIITGTVDEIELSKIATETTDSSVFDEHGNVKQTYDLNLSVKGKIVYPGVPVDVVLAIDLSNSMTASGSQNLSKTKTAAVNFINSILTDEDTAARVAVVAYGTYARAYDFSSTARKYVDRWDLYGDTKTGDVYYTKDKAKAAAVLNDSSFKPATLKPTGSGNNYTSYESGGTNTEAGFLAAKAVTDTRNRPDAVSIVIFMTDGIPTYRMNGSSVTGNGSSPSAADFNNAVTAAKALKQAGNEIYTVGLLTTYENNSYEMKMANMLLADDNSFTTSGSGNNWRYNKNGGAYSSKYYPVYSVSGSLDSINEVYTTLTKKSFALALGDVVDTIPADFSLLEENRQDLLEMGHQIIDNEDGTTTITFKDILATEDESFLPVIKVKYTGNGFGSAYLNGSARYIGKLYDSTPFDLEFEKPVAGLIPATINGEASAIVSEQTEIDVTANDLFAKQGFFVSNNEVSDYEIILVDENGNEVSYTEAEYGFIANVSNGKVAFYSSNSLTKTFYYVVRAVVSNSDQYAVNNSKVLLSRPTKVDVSLTEPDDPFKLVDKGYAYIFGYEPSVEAIENSDGSASEIVDIKMAMDDCVTREQVAAMLMRFIDQTFNTFAVDYPVTDKLLQHAGAWYERGLAYIASKGGFDDSETVALGSITRGEVAKLIVHSLNLTKTTKTSFADIDDSPHAAYIRTINAYGYMNGTSETTFEPSEFMTRAEFCKLFNNIIGRDDRSLIALDGEGIEYKVSAQTYNFTDMDPAHWAYETCLKATSAYNENGYVDVVTRTGNIRNILDKYSDQLKY
ncbi:MAG: VWA domain-containing protein [Firmicutes bacterium]|nr:VWA domain-containing protein [Bacillota bacterium]